MENSDELMRIYFVASCVRDLVNEVEIREKSEKCRPLISDEIKPTPVHAQYSQFPMSDEMYDEPPALDMEYFTDLLNVAPTQLPSIMQIPLTQPFTRHLLDPVDDLDEANPCDGDDIDKNRACFSDLLNLVSTQVYRHENVSIAESYETNFSGVEIPVASTTQRLTSTPPFPRPILAPIADLENTNLRHVIVEKCENFDSENRFDVNKSTMNEFDENTRSRNEILLWINKTLYPEMSLPILPQREAVCAPPVKFAKDKRFRVGLSKRQRLKRLHSPKR